jgi:16S rRNA (guanine(966)-N(2))-methyltransferase RsmD
LRALEADVPIRVIAGSAKGRRLKLVPGDTTRPIMDRVKESLFNIIGIDIVDSVFLDLFAGTGSVGIEALSRGAKKALFVEINKQAIQTIQDNLAITRLADKAVIRRGDALEFLKQKPAELYHYLYIAPPQYKGLWLSVLQILDDNPVWLTVETTVIVQIDPNEAKTVEFQHLELVDARRYGNTLLWFFTPLRDQVNRGATP